MIAMPEESPPWYSARWWLTLMCGIAFLYCIWARILPTEAIMGILMLVFQSDFMRSDRGGGTQEPEKPQKNIGK